MLSVEDASRQVLATAHLLPTETVPLAAAVGRVLRQEVVADRDFPPYNRVTMDGIAVQYSALQNGQSTFPIERTQLAGAPPAPLASPQAAIEIMTGAALPPGTDTIIRYEDLDISDTPSRQATVRVAPPRAGHNVHAQGSDQPAGARLLAPGLVLSPAEIAVAATVGAATLAVARRPRLAVVSTGDEIVPIEATPLPHQIRRSNGPMLCAALALAGCESQEFHLPDDLASLKTSLPALLADFDAVLLSGGVSKGQADFLPQALRELGVTEIFHRVAQRPGQPFWFGQAPGGAVVFALPGNPVATFANYYRYVQPWLRQCQGLPAEASRPVVAELAGPVEFKPALTYFLAVRLEQAPDGRLLAHPTPTAGSGDLAGLLAADGLLELPPDQSQFAAGTAWPLWRYRA
ncbi:molybdopterin molybdotransferase MoeA [Hymenobacter ginsengisoli]|uniref:Molybdopterin molybdenumtransferase n=1 Tax=Hymenobacter ginsengisoli TaxID=1051626 RepID=A0ABP8QRA2_9BACT|nr:molybdopterin molybdotransferase MoeA [Hymenobacter sp. KCTC 23674]MBO2033012.1 molybdopterin molybdotransferase MoeA [Hymenobacter sp. BT559]